MPMGRPIVRKAGERKKVEYPSDLDLSNLDYLEHRDIADGVSRELLRDAGYIEQGEKHGFEKLRHHGCPA
jgi:hypothetical protein